MTKSNPADVASRSLNLLHDSKNCVDLWLDGPPFLCCTYSWLPIPKFEDQTLEVMHVACPLPPWWCCHVEHSNTPWANLIHNLIMRHFELNASCCDIAILTIFTEFFRICAEDKLFPHHPDWSHQSYRIKNKLIVQKNAEMPRRNAEIALARHVQRFIFRRVTTKLLSW